MRGMDGQLFCVWSWNGCPLFAFGDEQIRTCAYIHTCDTLFTGEEMVLACFSFTKSF